MVILWVIVGCVRGRLRRVLSSLFDRDCGVIFLIGSGRSGKTATAFWMCENELKGRQKALYRYPAELLPSDQYYSVGRVDDVENGDVVVIDDTALHLPARSWGGRVNRLFVSWLTVSSHKDILVLVLVQNTALLDVRLFSSQDCLLVQKYIDWVVVQSERKEYKGLLSVGNLLLADASDAEVVDRRALSYVHDRGEIYRSGLVDFWSDSLSKPYRDVDVEAFMEGSF